MRITHSGNMCNLFCSSCGSFLTTATKVVGRGAKCKKCENARKKGERVKAQIRKQVHLIKMLGSKCEHCSKGVNVFSMVCFDFHHINKQDKIDTIGNMLASNRPIEVLEEEAKKCIILCASCHRLYHHIHGY